METTIKDLILADDTVIENRTKEKKAPRKPAEYEIVTVSGPDFAVRKKGSKISYLLVCICSKAQFYIRNEHTGETENLNAQGLTRFLSDVPKYDPLSITDADGNTPFWISELEHTRDFSENFTTAISNETLRKYFCKDMLSFYDVSDHIDRRRRLKYSDPAACALEGKDFKRAKFIFDQASEYIPREEVKAGFTRADCRRCRKERDSHHRPG